MINQRNLPKISIVTPCYNDEEYIEETIDSILSQGYPNLEYIIMDGGSRDDSVEIIKKYTKYLTYWQSEPDGGMYDAINKGFKLATGEILAWMNSNDKYHQDAFFKVAAVFMNHPDIKWVTGRPTCWDKQGNLCYLVAVIPQWTRKILLETQRSQTDFIQQESTFWRRSLWEEAGSCVNSEVRTGGDFELWLRFTRFAQLYFVDTLLGGFRIHPSSQSIKFREAYMDVVFASIESEKKFHGEIPLLPSPPSISISKVLINEVKCLGNDMPPNTKPLADVGFTNVIPFKKYFYDSNELRSNFSTVRLLSLPKGSTSRILPNGSWDFNYSKKTHFRKFQLFGKYSGHDISHIIESFDLKSYQDLLIYTFIDENFLPGARLLEIGGGDSRVIQALQGRYEIWNLDMFEGLGNGPTQVNQNGFRIIQDYIGNFNPALKDNYFDCVFSISTLEHISEERVVFENIVSDINRVLKPGGVSIHCLDTGIRKNEVIANGFIQHLINHVPLLHEAVPIKAVVNNPDLFTMSKKGYEQYWEPITKTAYADWGEDFSYNLAWQKQFNKNNEPQIQFIQAHQKDIFSTGHDCLVSVIVSNYKSEEFMGECLTDLMNQTIADQIEVIIIDADSPENERKVVEEFQNNYKNITYIRTKERIGIYTAWNMAIKISQGQYITPFSTNDRLRKDAYEIMGKSLDENPDVMMVYGDSYMTVLPHETFDNHTRTGSMIWPNYYYPDLLRTCMVGPHPMWRRNVHEQIGYFDERYFAISDQEFWLRMGQNFNIIHISEFTGLFWTTTSSISGNREISLSEINDIQLFYQDKYPEESTIRNYVLSLVSEYEQQLLLNLSENKLKISVKQLEAFNELAPNVARLLFALGAFYIRLQEHGKAIEYIRKGLLLEPEKSEKRFLLIEMLLKVNDINSARDELIKIQEGNPNHPKINNAEIAIIITKLIYQNRIMTYPLLLLKYLFFRVPKSKRIMGILKTKFLFHLLR